MKNSKLTTPNSLLTTKVAIMLALTIACLLLPQAAQAATTYYVDIDGVGPDGVIGTADDVVSSDTNPGTSEQPWKTTTKAGNAAVAGDTVLFAPGTYTAQLAPVRSGTSGSMITFKATTRRTAVISPGVTTNATALNGRSYIRIEGFEITGSQNVFVATFGGYSTHLEFVDNCVYGNHGFGIYITARTQPVGWGKDVILVEDNEFYDNSGNGVFIEGDDVIIRNNKVHYNGVDGIEGGGTNWLIENNLVYDYKGVMNHQDGINCSKLTNGIIRYNIVHDYTQNIYFPLSDNGGGLNNVKIYGNLCYTAHTQINPVNGNEIWAGKGIYIAGENDSSSIINVEIHSNTIGWHPFSNITILANEASTCSNIKIYNNLLYGDPIYASILVTASKQSVVTSNYNFFSISAKPSFEGANSIIADPCFVDYQERSSHNNFHLKSNSPARNIGNPNLASDVTLPDPFVDIDGTTRPQYPTYDIGAYEYTDSGSDIPGDINSDGSVDAIDLQLLINTILSGSFDSKADLNKDSSVDAVDLQALVNIILGA